MARSLNGRVVAVVGSTGVLGAEIARVLASRGATVVRAGRRRDAVDVVVDLHDAGSGDALVAYARDRHGRLDGVVIAAGVVTFGPLADTDDEVIEELFLTNAIGPLWLARRVIPALVETRGFLVHLSGVVASQPMAGMAAYSASKAAMAAGLAALGRELRRSGVLVCDAQPPHTETGLATRPLAGQAPAMPRGLDPAVVAERVVEAVERDEARVLAADFA